MFERNSRMGDGGRDLDDLLEALTGALRKDPLHPQSVYDSARALLEALALPLCNTAENCERVDHAVFLACDGVELSSLGPDLQSLIADIGGCLHDAHSAPEVAFDFESTPTQLLERIRRIPRPSGG
jgi:hypothetical protein